MGIINYGGKVELYATDTNAVQICRLRKDCSCGMCKKKLRKGEIVVSKDSHAWYRFCLDCYPKLFERVRAELKRFEKLMKETEKDLKLNVEKYRTQNIVSSI